MNKKLGDVFPKIEQVGCIIPKKRLTSKQVISLFQRDLGRVTSLASKLDPTGYFSRKVKVIQHAFGKFKAECDGQMHEVSYAPGCKYIYPGLPVQFAEYIDPAIRNVLDLIAQCQQVMLSGMCCAGHPSAIIKNPNIIDNPNFASINRMNAQFGEFIFSHNQNPYLTMLVSEKGDLRKELLGVRAQVQIKNASIEICAKETNIQMFFAGYPRLSIIGRPRLTLFEDRLTHRQFVELYQKALVSFWIRIQEIFERVVGLEIPRPKAQWFNGAQINWDYEIELIKRRAAEGYSHANYYYFFGKKSTVDPKVITQNNKTHHL
jgi:hypothetical protein